MYTDPVDQYIYAIQKYGMVHELQDGSAWRISFRSCTHVEALNVLYDGFRNTTVPWGRQSSLAPFTFKHNCNAFKPL